MAQLEPLMQQNFIEYASYVILDRAIPALRDGCKPVQRRILTTLHDMEDGKFHKVANVIGETMKLHPHGDASIGDALVVLASKGLFLETQGNFGNPLTGHRAAAPRYIECRLSALARETLFNEDLTEFVPSYDGRKQEAVHLPAKLPVLLLMGTEGIAVGMSTRILPHNFCELLAAQIRILEKKSVKLLPDFPGGGLMDASEYDDGSGKVRVRARITARGDKTVVINEVPYQVTTEGLIASIESAAQKGRIRVGSVNDYTTDKVEIEVTLPRGVYADEVIPQLWAYTDCEVTLHPNLVAIVDGQPRTVTVSEALNRLTEQLVEILRGELQHELQRLLDRQHWITLEQIFIENRIYKKIERQRTAERVQRAVWDGMHEYEVLFLRPMVADDVERLLRIAIRRISAFDIERSRQALQSIDAEIKAVRNKLRRMRKTTIAYLQSLLERFGGRFPRRTEATTFDAVDRKAVARQNIKMSYDSKTGFFGSQVRGAEHQLIISEYDRILIVSRDGSYRIVGPTEKLLVGRIVDCRPFDPEAGVRFTIVYRDKKRMCYGKRVHIQKFIRDREYQLIKNKEGRIDFLSDGDDPGIATLKFPPAKRQRVHSVEFDLGELDETGITARGRRLAAKAVSSVRVRPRNRAR